MPTLSIVKTDFRKGIKWGAILIGILIILFIVLKFLFFVKEIFFPSAPPPPTVTFGKLPQVYFPDGIKKDFTYEIDTLSGDLPKLNFSEKVYKMEQKGPDILAVERASKKVSQLGFPSRPQQISDFVYKWTNLTPPEQTLILNIKLSEFSLSSNYQSQENILKGNNFTDKSLPITSATNFLKTLEFYPNDLDEEKTKVEFLKLDGGATQSVTKATDSNLANVYFFQKSKDDLPIVYPQGSNSSMRLTIGGGGFIGKVLDASFSYQNILEENATYPLKTSQEAFDDLKNGKGYIASYNGNDTNVLIKKVYTALYSEGRIQEYLTPVIVFEGNNGFLAFVPGIKEEWINK